uniref:Uncharacterized protein n=1 Tax=Cuerna arida TaxID=1464854 RepID=A0A1B6FK24_9HEMI
MANNIYDYDETNPLRQPQRDVLRYSSQPEEDSSYLVELPEDLPELSPPPHHPTLRSRNTTIVNTSYLPESPEEEQEPLEAYIKKNLIIFRKSLTPDGLTYTSRRIPSEKGDEGSLVVIPGNIEESAFNLNHPRSENIIKDNIEKEMAKPDNLEYDERKDSQHDDNVGSPALLDNDDIHNREDGIHSKINDTVVMQISDHVALNHNSPFRDEKNKTNSQPVSPVQVIVMVDSHEHKNDKDYLKDKKSTKKGYNELEEDGLGAEETTWSRKDYDKSDPNRTILHRSKGMQDMRGKDNDPENFSKVTDGKGGIKRDGKSDPDRMVLDRSKGMQNMRGKEKDPEKFNKVMDGRGNKTKDGKTDPDRMGLDRSKGMQNMRENDNDPDKFSKVMDGKGEKRKDGKFDPNKNFLDGTKEMQSTKEKDNDQQKPSKAIDEKDGKRKDGYKTGISNQTPDSKQKKDRKYKDDLEDSDEEYYNKPKDFSGKTGNIMKTKPGKSAADDKRPTGNEPTQDYKRTNANSEVPKTITVKAPKTASQMYATKRYHIQIPQHGRPETWFNVCFNLDHENNVDMNYEGPVKITNYYSSNKYS